MRTLHERVLELYRILWDELEDIMTEPDLADRHGDAVRPIHQTMNRVAEIIREHRFVDEAEEIAFFKCFKPMFTSLLVFHSMLYNLYLHWPATRKEQEELVQRMILDPIRSFRTEKKEFIRYSRSNGVHNDRYGYLRSMYDILANFHPEDAYNDLSFCTNFDQLQGVLLAYDDLEEYCLDGRVYGTGPAEIERPARVVPWQLTKADWCLLMDALAAVKAFGDMTAQEIHNLFGPIAGVKADLAGARRDREMLKIAKRTLLHFMIEALKKLDEDDD